MPAFEIVHTPCPGVMMRRTQDGVAVVRLHYSANPTCTPEWVAAERKKYTTDAWWNLEMEIEYEALSGQRVYPEFDPAVHVVPDAAVPKKGARYMSIDPHPRTPHAALWILIDAYSDWYIYRELWPSMAYAQPHDLRDDTEDYSYTIREYAETMAVLEGNSLDWRNAETDNEYAVYVKAAGGERIVVRLMDQASKGFRASGENQHELSYAERYGLYGIQCSDPYKSHRSGEDAIHSLLKLRKHETRGLWPRLHVAASCRETILELMRHRFKVTKRVSPERELKQEGVEARCHMIDNLRYLATSNIHYSASLAS
jgi:hypothetical protein